MVEVWRGDVAESHHRGHAVICDAARRDPRRLGRPRGGDPAALVLQDAAGAAAGRERRRRRPDRRAAGARLRLAQRRGDARDPGRALARRARARRGRPALRPAGARGRARARTGCAPTGAAPSQLHNNCSGKHAGFLMLNRRLGGGPGVRRDRPPGAAGGARRLRGDVRRRRAPAGASTAARRRTSPPRCAASRSRWRAWPTRAASGRRARRRRGGWSRRCSRTRCSSPARAAPAPS